MAKGAGFGFDGKDLSWRGEGAGKECECGDDQGETNGNRIVPSEQDLKRHIKTAAYGKWRL
jgi:hypothetical protein